VPDWAGRTTEYKDRIRLLLTRVLGPDISEEDRERIRNSTQRQARRQLEQTIIAYLRDTREDPAEVPSGEEASSPKFRYAMGQQYDIAGRGAVNAPEVPARLLD
jgi:hypothetical protein